MGKTSRRNFEVRPDVLIADVMMPRLDGFEMVRRIRKTDDHTPVLFLTAKSTPDDVVTGFELGANDYLKKPFAIQELIIRIKALMGKAYMTERQESEQNEYTLGDYRFTPAASRSSSPASVVRSPKILASASSMKGGRATS